MKSIFPVHFFDRHCYTQGLVIVVIKILLSNGLLCVFLTLAVSAGSLWEAVPLRILEGRFFDQMLRLRQEAGLAPVAVVAIDSESLAVKGDWPWPRAVLADMVEHLTVSGARMVGFYPLFANREQNPGLQEIRHLRREIDNIPLADASLLADILHQTEVRSDGDNRLSTALRLAPRPVLPLLFSFSEKAPRNHDPSPLLLRNSLAWTWTPYPWKTAVKMLVNPLEGVKDTIPTASGALLPLAELTKSNSYLGHVNQIPDPDGRVRFEYLMVRLGDRLHPSFILQMTAAWHNTPLANWRLDEVGDGITEIRLGPLQIPVDRGFRMPIAFDRTGKAFSLYPFTRVADGLVSAESFRGKAVLIGVTAAESAPMHATPMGEDLAGVEIAAHALAGLLSRQHLSRPGWTFFVELLFILQLGFFLAIIIPRVRPLPGLLLMAGFLAIWFGAAAALLVTKGFWLKTAAPTLLVVLGFATVHLRRFMTDSPQDYEDLKMLGLSLQGQGMLDLALEKFKKCPVSDPSIRELLYNLGLDFERKRMFNKAAAAYAHLLRGGKFRDAKQRMFDLGGAEQTLVLGAGGISWNGRLDESTRPTLGRYEIVRELGQGAMGTVYLGNDPTIHRAVAIKTLPYDSISPDLLAEVKNRFFREAEAAGRLNHPNIVTIFDAGEEHDMAYIAMEFLDGTDLTPYCRKDNLLPAGRVLELVAQIADALDYAHAQDVVHRDIKPANIMLLGNGTIKVTDFGIARILSTSQTQTGTLMGTPTYMSPEQVAGKKVDGRSDLFSLGIVLYELLSGSKPFQGENMAALMYSIAKGTYPPLPEVTPGRPPCCAGIIDKLLAKGANRRFRSAAVTAEKLRLCRREIG
jgi:eukaryotic-like serine/threonine-protein kinase